ncbi:MAG: hypothetical protein JWM02_257 [Frankiales bacterium]|nr:hypothetical protein [Frankiales bacterium]
MSTTNTEAVVPSDLSDEDRRLYAGLADVLIPNAEGMPSASEADVPIRWIDEALRVRPDLRGSFAKAVEVARDLPAAEAVERLNSLHVEAFEGLGTLTAGAYFLNPDVRALIGYPGQQPSPAQDDTDTYLDLLGAVVDRGPIYRDPQATGA